MVLYCIESSGAVKINLTNSTDLIDLKYMAPSVFVETANMFTQKIVTLRYDNSILGPIYAKDEHEIKNIFVLFKDKVECRKYKDKCGEKLIKTYTKSLAALKARTSLPPDVVDYLDSAFTKSRTIYKLGSIRVLTQPFF